MRFIGDYQNNMKKKPDKCEACLEKDQRYIEWYEEEEMWLCDECNEELTNRRAHD